MWSRDGAGSTTVTGTRALNPARRSAPFTWALATPVACSIGSRAPPPPLISNGSRPGSPRWRTCAPAATSGSNARLIGRLLSEASPSRVALTGEPATRPSSRRAVVPLFPQSMTPAGVFSSRGPSIVTSPRGSQSGGSAPSARIAAAVAATSAPCERPANRLAPAAKGASIRTRCEIDLSPGT